MKTVRTISVRNMKTVSTISVGTFALRLLPSQVRRGGCNGGVVVRPVKGYDPPALVAYGIVGTVPAGRGVLRFGQGVEGGQGSERGLVLVTL
jgi:hypothetical protein